MDEISGHIDVAFAVNDLALSIDQHQIVDRGLVIGDAEA
jgi:hypothetical protein